MNNMAHMRNCPEGCMVDQIRSWGNCNFYLPSFSLIHDQDLIKRQIKTVSDALTKFLGSLLDQNALFMPYSTNMINITRTDWQNLTTIYMNPTSEQIELL